VQQILRAEICLKAAVGLALVVAPSTLIRMAGISRPEGGFWPRLLGAVSLGITAGIWLGVEFPAARGAIGAAGLVSIDLLAACALLAPLTLSTAAPTRWGKLFVAANVVLLLALAFLEIAHV